MLEVSGEYRIRSSANLRDKNLAPLNGILVDKKLRLLAFVPLLGIGGMSLNEGQLMNALANYVEIIYCFSFVSIREIIFRKIPKMAVLPKENVKVILLPSLPLPPIFLPITIVYYSLIAIFCLMMRYLLELDIFYVRDKSVGMALLIFKPLIRCPIAIKFGGFTASEHTPSKCSKMGGIYLRLEFVVDDFLLRRGDVILVSSSTMEKFLREIGYVRNRMALCPAGVDINIIKKHIQTRTLIKNERPRIGFLGSLSWWQGVDILARAVAIVKERIPGVELFIVGDGPMRKKVDEICKLNGVSCVITGFVTHEKALDYLRTFDVLVLPRPRTPTTDRVIPIKVIEAQALGVPLIVTRHKVFIEMGLKDKEHLLYCNPEPHDLASKILLLLEDKQLRLKISENSIAFAEAFSYDKIAVNVLSALRSHYSVDGSEDA